ncbi:MAG: sulfatase [Adhaeribacter sp.]
MLSFRFPSKCLWVLLSLCLPTLAPAKPVKAPNVIVILADDMGYGDLSCYGHPTIRTPHLDQMAAEGMRFTQFYVAANVCTPSRAALLTGRLPVRSGMAGSDASGNVLYPHSAGGLPQSEITLARALKAKGYQTGIIGKWHLGHLPAFLPPSHGFDFYFGIPYSNDMLPGPNNKVQPLPLYQDKKVLEENPDQSQLTRRYTEQALAFIRKNKDKPFFLYYPNNFPHVPLHASAAYKGKSKRGLYGDVVEELDGSVGQILKTLRELQLDKNTLVIFTSDNGPWLLKKEEGGSAGLLFEGKGAAYEGGMRVPAIAWWPGTIPARQVNPALATTLDLFPTILKLAGAALPSDRVLDGTDLYPLLTGQKKEVREFVYYYNRDKLYAIRKGPWKAHFITKPSYKKVEPEVHATPLLFNLDQDPGEKFNLNKKHPQVVAAIRQEYERHQASITPVTSHLDAVLER